MLVVRAVALLSAALQASSYLLPGDLRASIDPLLLETRQEDVEDHEYNLTTRIGSFRGCSVDQVDDAQQAWKDAVMIANSIGDPDMHMPNNWLFHQFFGQFNGVED